MSLAKGTQGDNQYGPNPLAFKENQAQPAMAPNQTNVQSQQSQQQQSLTQGQNKGDNPQAAQSLDSSGTEVKTQGQINSNQGLAPSEAD